MWLTIIYYKYCITHRYDKPVTCLTFDCDILTKCDFLPQLRSRKQFWDYISQVAIPGLYDNKWYDGTYHSELQGFMADGTGYLVGQPRLRQVRTVPGKTISFLSTTYLRDYIFLWHFCFKIVILSKV